MNTPTGSERAVRTLNYLRDNISSGQWPLNSKIPTEAELVALLGVGRTTVREAVRSLASLGMLEPLAGRGTFVRSLNPVSSVIADFVADFDLPEVLGYRRALEVEAAQLAAANRSDEHIQLLRAAHERDLAKSADAGTAIEQGRSPGQFHALIFEAAGSKLLASLYAGVMATLRKQMRAGVIVYCSDDAERQHDHADILDALAAGNIAESAHLMAQHVDRDLAVDYTDPRTDSVPKYQISPSATPPRQQA